MSALLLLAGCSSSPQKAATGPDEASSYVIVMSAFSPELTRLLEEAKVREIQVVDGDTCHVGSLNGLDVVLVLSGIGLEKAAARTAAVLEAFSASALVFSGIAGGINPSLNIGDVTVPARWGFSEEKVGEDELGFWFPVDSTMLEAARGAAGTVTLSDCTADSVCLESAPVIAIGGNGVSNSFFVDDAEYREWLWDTFSANAVDMETAAVARVAGAKGVPYIAFRSLSDLAGGGPGANEVDTFFQLAADNAATVVLAFITAWAAESAN
jgi:adenosylhomocysteine nucleosidase